MDEVMAPYTPMETAGAAFKAAAIPGTLVAIGGDILSPMDVWIVPLVAGFLALLLLLLLWWWDAPRIVIRRRLGTKDRLRFWREPFPKSAAFWALALFGVAGVFAGIVSQSRASQGGLIASNVQAIAELQRMTGIAEQSLVVQKQISEGVGDLVEIGNTGQAVNPRVTLRNRGVDWTAGSLDDALLNRDMETVQLFLQGGMGIDRSVGNASDLARFFRNYSPEVAAVLIKHQERIPAHACLPNGFGFSGSLRDWLVDDTRLKLYTQLCNKPEVRSKLQEFAGSGEHKDAKRANASIGADRRACKARLKQEFGMEKAATLGFPPSIDGNSTIDAPEERVAVGFQRLLNTPGLDDAHLTRAYEALIDASCDESFVEQPVAAGDDFYAKVRDAF